jgi:hypothetical protein
MSMPKPPMNLVKLLIGELIAVLGAMEINQISGSTEALMVFLAVSWLAYSMNSKEKIWNTLASLANPARSIAFFASASLTYFAFQGFSSTKLLLAALGATVIGSGLALVLYGYWTIGD